MGEIARVEYVEAPNSEPGSSYKPQHGPPVRFSIHQQAPPQDNGQGPWMESLFTFPFSGVLPMGRPLAAIPKYEFRWLRLQFMLFSVHGE
jgi:hypothetical protein